MTELILLASALVQLILVIDLNKKLKGFKGVKRK